MPAPIIIYIGNYYKLASDGVAPLTIQDAAWDENGTEAAGTKWSCVLDKTGLVWEIKTDDEGLRDKDKTYRWGGDNSAGGNTYPDWDALVTAANTEGGNGLCGYNDWRVPTQAELNIIYDTTQSPAPYIEKAIFPYSVQKYWSATIDIDDFYALYIDFQDSVGFRSLSRQISIAVRLVRGQGAP